MKRADCVAPAVAAIALSALLAHGCRERSRAAPERDAGNPVAPAPSASEEGVPLDVPQGSLAFEVLDGQSGNPIPCKLTLRGLGKTKTPKLGGDARPGEIEGGVASRDKVYSLSGRGSFRLPQGDYDVTVSHGPEWSVYEARGVHIGAEGANVAARLEHAVSTPGWVSADLHVHAEPSWDSAVPLSARVIEFISEGVGILVATDHNVVTDYGPAIEDLGVKQLLGTVAGSEISTVDWGHFGAFPLEDDKSWWVLHGVRIKGQPAESLLGEVRRRNPRALISVNHPRMGNKGYFVRAAFDRVTARFGKLKSSLDFDSVEVMNGYEDPQRDHVDMVLADWFSLLLHGRRVTAVGNSDTHRLMLSYAGYPRNYVKLGPGAAEDGEALAAGIKAGNAFFTTGPFVEVDIDGKGLGEVVSAKSTVTLHVRVRAAPWVSVAKVRVLVDGATEHTWDVEPSEAPNRFEGSYELSPARDAFVTLDVEGGSLGVVVGGEGHRPLPSMAITNPIYLDVDGNGRYDAPLK